MNRHIRGRDVNGAQILHFEEIAPGDWRGVDFDRSRGIAIYSWETAITRIANLIGPDHRGDRFLYELEISEPPAHASIDRAGNIWLDHEYLAPHQYLPALIPEKLS